MTVVVNLTALGRNDAVEDGIVGGALVVVIKLLKLNSCLGLITALVTLVAFIVSFPDLVLWGNALC